MFVFVIYLFTMILPPFSRSFSSPDLYSPSYLLPLFLFLSSSLFVFCWPLWLRDPHYFPKSLSLSHSAAWHFDKCLPSQLASGSVFLPSQERAKIGHVSPGLKRHVYCCYLFYHHWRSSCVCICPFPLTFIWQFGFGSMDRGLSLLPA